MRGLFLKTFLWFWLTVILAILALSLPALFSQIGWSRVAANVLQPTAEEAVSTYESSGDWALIEYLGRLRREQPIEGFLLRDGHDVLASRPIINRDVVEMAKLAQAEKVTRRLRGSYAAQVIRSPVTGKVYTFVLALRGSYGTRLAPLIQVPLTVVLVGTLFCYLIARHVTSPLFKLRAAASRIAEGKLDTRVAPSLGHRRDEIAGLARDFDRMAERIEVLLTGQKSLLADVSHELRSPLSRLTVALSLAQNCPPAETPEHLARIQAEARKLDKLIGQLLLLSRIDSGVNADERAPINFGNLVQEIASDADFEARARGRQVVADCDGSCTITGSEDIVRSAVENVVRNAVRHTQEGTAVEVALRCEGSRAVLRVQDHGAGVPEPLLSEMFLAFRRVGTGSNGAGLGLAIAERAVRAHGGSVHAENAPGGGLLVQFELPILQR